MRLVTGIALVVEGVMSLRGGISIGAAILHVLGAGAGILLLAGLWTPIAGVLVATLALWQAFSHPENPLALLGPGGWSVDARLFGWKRIDIRDRKN
jgi:putative oxidoreductase